MAKARSFFRRSRSLKPSRDKRRENRPHRHGAAGGRRAIRARSASPSRGPKTGMSPDPGRGKLQPPRRSAAGRAAAAHPRGGAERRLRADRQRQRREARAIRAVPHRAPRRARRSGKRRCRRASGKRPTQSSPATPTRKGWAAGAFPKTPLGETWPMRHDGIDYLGRFTSFRHVGVFPEQASHWDHMAGLIESARRPVKVLNLFGYTGAGLAGGGARRRRGHPCRRLQEGDRLGAREPGDGRPCRQADPLDLRGRHEICRTRGAPRQPLRHHPVRPAGLRARPQGRGLAVVRGPAGADRHLPRRS